jgi:hypothetical protein
MPELDEGFILGSAVDVAFPDREVGAQPSSRKKFIDKKSSVPKTSLNAANFLFFCANNISSKQQRT